MILHHIRVAIALLCLMAWPAYAQKTPAQIRTDINTLFPDNDQNRITPFDLRFVTTEITSAYLPVTSVIPSANIPPATNGGLGGIFAVACASNLWIQTITTGTGSPDCTQINFSNLAGSASVAQIAASPAAHATPIDVAGTPIWSVVPNCLDSLGQHVNYAQSTDAWSCGTSTNAGPGVGSVDNLLPNVQWQMITGDVLNVKQNATGTGPQTPASCASFSTTNASPTFICANTQQIKVGDIIAVATSASFTTAAYDAFWGFSGGGYISCNAGTVACTATFGSAGGCSPGSGGTANSCYIMGARVITVVPNTSITVQGYFIGVSPTVSTAAVLYPIARTSGGLNIGPDGWSITTSLTSFPDDFSAHSYPGAIRVLGTRGGAAGTESLTWTVPANQVGRFQGIAISCGVAANQTVQGGANTWSISITDSSGTTSSSVGTGVAFGGYQFEPVTRTITAGATSVSVSLNKLGNNGDVIYWALPTCAFIPSIVQGQVHQNSDEYIAAQGHCNPPLLTPLILQFNNPIGTLWGWTDLDLEAISLGCYHKSLGGVMAKIEWTTTSVNSTLITTTDNTFSSFGPQAYTNVSGVGNMGGPSLQRLTSQGTFGMVSNVHNLIPTSGTWDWWDGVASMPNSVH